MKKNKLDFLVFTALALLFLFAGCGKKETGQAVASGEASAKSVAQQVIKIGTISPNTGNTAFLGELMGTLVEYVGDEVNGMGGINGAKVEIIREDSAGTSVGAATAAQKLINVDKVTAIIGPLFTTCVLAAKPIAEQSKTPLIVATSSHKDIFAENGYVFSIDAANEVSVKLLSKYLYDEKGFRKLSILGSYNDQTLDMINIFDRLWKEYGGNDVSHATFNPGTEDFRTDLTLIKNQNPDVIWIKADADEMKTIVRQMFELGLDKVFIATDYQAIQAADFFDSFGKLLDGHFCYTQNGLASDAPTKAKYDAFTVGYRARYGNDPDAMVVLYYDTFYILFEALKKGTYSGEALRNAIGSTEDFTGASGYVTFDSWGRSTGSSTIVEYKDGKSFVSPFKIQ
jgi:branched-chain amino acid transport system substrate-binding protein